MYQLLCLHSPQIYNEALFDLLADHSGDAAQEDLQVMDDAKGAVSIKGLNKLVAQVRVLCGNRAQSAIIHQKQRIFPVVM